MFTGIVEATAPILEQRGSSLVLGRPRVFDDIKLGSSIAVAGVCLSVTAFDDRSMAFDVIPTTLKKTKLGTLKAGDAVNVERAMPAHGRFDGHVVQGHCDTVSLVRSVEDKTDDNGHHRAIVIELPDSLKPLVVLHGSITVDGVSLTVATLDAFSFSVSLIPHTIKHTTLHALKKGDHVNLEADILGKYALQKTA
ncbi:MAG TPA: riboflavin synthase [Candidatus Peribacteria bacterium]|nr:riboflavin synthase [Candidatus Peribacteria bacterium]